ncbi:hypothetical protein C1645_835172 [Glomus cerebriforme]|uniref:Uncharacterized protein n=1 Tax=Glomus cerebriforme TaxID=658196 RepID=A0A397SJ91_9GLOM|nr:hypothetical protein C1645_835172 [Glomus cerebriforme]
MGATISQHTDLFYNEHIASLEAKNFCRLEWATGLEGTFEELQSKDLIISELTTSLDSACDLINRLQQEKANHFHSLEQIPTSVENLYKEISSGSTSTNNTNDNSILQLITIPDDQPMQPHKNQQ